jgi:hypothetical protein
MGVAVMSSRTIKAITNSIWKSISFPRIIAYNRFQNHDILNWSFTGRTSLQHVGDHRNRAGCRQLWERYYAATVEAFGLQKRMQTAIPE